MWYKFRYLRIFLVKRTGNGEDADLANVHHRPNAAEDPDGIVHVVRNRKLNVATVRRLQRPV